jgi:hypothetical protein
MQTNWRSGYITSRLYTVQVTGNYFREPCLRKVTNKIASGCARSG